MVPLRETEVRCSVLGFGLYDHSIPKLRFLMLKYHDYNSHINNCRNFTIATLQAPRKRQSVALQQTA